MATNHTTSAFNIRKRLDSQVTGLVSGRTSRVRQGAGNGG